MNKEEIYNYLEEEGIPFEVDEHKAVYNMEEHGNSVTLVEL